MTTAITTALGTSEIKVGLEPRRMQRVYHGFAGVNGLTTMAMGARGYALPIIGKRRVAGVSYAAARSAMIVALVAIENLQSLGAATYSYGIDTYQHCIWERFRTLPGPTGKTFHYHPNGDMTVDFMITLRSLL